MARVKLYDRRTLASSTVGTPGVGQVDTSASQVLGSIAQGVGGLADTANQLLNAEIAENNRQLRAAEARQREEQKRLDGLRRGVEVGYIKAQAQTKSAEVINRLQQDHMWDTTGIEQKYQEEMGTYLDTTVDGIQDEETRLQFQQQAAPIFSQGLTGLANFKQQRFEPIAKQQLKGTAAEFTKAINSATYTEAEVTAKVAQYRQDNADAYKVLYGGAYDAEMTSDIGAGVENYVSAVALTGNPERLDAILQSDVVKENLDNARLKTFAEQKQKQVREADAFRRKEETERQIAADVDYINELVSIAPGGRVSQLSPKQINDFIEKTPHMSNRLKSRLVAAKAESEDLIKRDASNAELAAILGRTHRYIDKAQKKVVELELKMQHGGTSEATLEAYYTQIEALIGYTEKAKDLTELLKKDPQYNHLASANAAVLAVAEKRLSKMSGDPKRKQESIKRDAFDNRVTAYINKFKPPLADPRDREFAERVYGHYMRVYMNDVYTQARQEGKLDSVVAKPAGIEHLLKNAHIGAYKAVRQAMNNRHARINNLRNEVKRGR